MTAVVLAFPEPRVPADDQPAADAAFAAARRGLPPVELCNDLVALLDEHDIPAGGGSGNHAIGWAAPELWALLDAYRAAPDPMPVPGGAS